VCSALPFFCIVWVWGWVAGMVCVTEGGGPRGAVQSLTALQGLATPWTVPLPAERIAPWDCGLGPRCHSGMGLSSEVVHTVLQLFHASA